MATNAEQFLISFNRIEKWLKETLNNPSNMGFSEMTRRVAHKEKKYFSKYEDDLLQMAQLRNAIVHERIASDFVIAEPNDWAVGRIQQIERAILEPERVLPKFQKKVVSFAVETSLSELLSVVAKERYSQFPIYKNDQFAGLITASGLGIWFAVESMKETLQIQDRKAEELLTLHYKTLNYQFVHGNTRVDEVEAFFSKNNLLEAVLITKNGQTNEPILGIIRPKDIYTLKEKE